MENTLDVPPNPHRSTAGAQSRIYHCGTLTYTRQQLAKLFFWLLWGDFCFILMETVVPSILPLKFKALGTPDTSIGLIMVTIPMLLNTVFNPVISFRSDRFRSRWGRRIPFILCTLPLLVFCLIAIGYADSFGFWLHRVMGAALARFSPNQVATCAIGAFMIFFSFFNTFVNSVFWYLFNDVVPQNLLARFMSWQRTVSQVSTSLYYLLIFRFAGTHFHAIFIGTGIIYVLGFGLMCFNVKEGEYPPAPENLNGKSGLFSAIKTFGAECHSHSLYWYTFLSTTFASLALCITPFMYFFYQETGLNLDQIGFVLGSISITSAILILGSGWLADRYHPFRVVIAGYTMQLFLVLPATSIWLFWHPASGMVFKAWLIISIGLTAPAAALIGVCDPPLLMRIFSRERYGQFCAANAMWRSAGAIVGGWLAGFFLVTLKHYTGTTAVYRYIPVWQIACYIPVLYCTIKQFQYWKSCGGDRAYAPPLPEGWQGGEPGSSIINEKCRSREAAAPLEY